jgi:hypothetical protein
MIIFPQFTFTMSQLLALYTCKLNRKSREDYNLVWDIEGDIKYVMMSVDNAKREFVEPDKYENTDEESDLEDPWTYDPWTYDTVNDRYVYDNLHLRYIVQIVKEGINIKIRE